MSHPYAVRVAWSGDTGAGYAQYSREHTARLPPAEGVLDLSADRSFAGDPALPNPESLLLAAASSCHLLSFLAVAARAGVVVTAYEDDAEAVLDLDHDPQRMDGVVLRPRIVVGAGTDVALVERLSHEAHEQCYIANTLAVDVRVEPLVVVR